MLVPFYFLVGQWGGRATGSAATFKLVIYTLVGSLLMLAAAVATGVLRRRGADGATIVLDRRRSRRAPLGEGTQRWIFVALRARVPDQDAGVPVPRLDARRATATMPLPVLAVFSGVLSKVAAYGFLRVALPIFPDAAEDFQIADPAARARLDPLRLGAGVHADEHAADPRLLVDGAARLHHARRSSRSARPTGAQGALLQTVNHGLVVAPLFFIIALLAERDAARRTSATWAAIAFRAPVLAALFLIVALATLAMPGSANFVGEFLILLGLFNAKLVIAIIAFTGVAMASVYMLRAFIRAMHNRRAARASTSCDLQRRATGSCSCRSWSRSSPSRVYPQAALEDSAAVGRARGGGRRRRSERGRRSRRRRRERRRPQGPEDRLAGDLAAGRAVGRRLRRADGRAAARRASCATRSCRC